MSYKVKSHTRRMKNGRTTTVRPHRRGVPNPSHAWTTGRKAYKAARSRRRAAAAAFILWAVLEVGLWAAFNIVGVVAGALGAALIGVCVVAVRRRDGSRASGRW